MRKDERGHRGPDRVVAARCCTSGKAPGLEQIAMGFPIDRSELKSIKSTLIRKKSESQILVLEKKNSHT